MSIQLQFSNHTFLRGPIIASALELQHWPAAPAHLIWSLRGADEIALLVHIQWHGEIQPAWNTSRGTDLAESEMEQTVLSNAHEPI
jgi:hypothetical protein